jgi:hypothetical protein
MGVSLLTLLSGFLILWYSVAGLKKDRPYERNNFLMASVFSLSLYTQFLLGFLIYYFLRGSLESPLFLPADPGEDHSLRFWAIEHIAWMIVAMMLTLLGRLFIKRTAKSRQRHRAALFYYGSSLCLILISLALVIFSR